MRVLTINCGSSSLKFDVLEIRDATKDVARVAGGSISRLGPKATSTLSIGDRTIQRSGPVQNHARALEEAVALLREAGLLDTIEAVGHRVVHGGATLRAPALIDADVIETISAVSALAPLHNQPALEAIAAAQTSLSGALPMIATFDTAFYADLPEVASIYALPKELSDALSIRRYGFHGLAHRYMVERYRKLRPAVRKPRLITLQLGNGCSATASLDGMPLDTSMGFTPLEGLIMGTRSGDLDPSLPLYLAAKQGFSAEQVDSLLNSESGLMGISGLSNDMRDLVQAAADGHARAELAVEAFCYRIRKYVGAYLAVLGGADAVIFGGGIGENSPEVRKRVCRGLAWAGLSLDLQTNQRVVNTDTRVSSDGSTIEAWTVRVDEAAVIASDTLDCLLGRESQDVG